MTSYVRLLVVIHVMLFTACNGNPAQPTRVTPVAQPVVDITYAINVPDAVLAIRLAGEHPDGVRVAPMTAQIVWDYTSAYGGSPNVYYGEMAPRCNYIGVGVVVAPRSAASQVTFLASDWPGFIGLKPGMTYAWLGRFAYAAIPTPGTYGYDPTGAKCWQPGK